MGIVIAVLFLGLAWTVGWCVAGYQIGKQYGHPAVGFWWAFFLGPIGCLLVWTIYSSQAQNPQLSNASYAPRPTTARPPSRNGAMTSASQHKTCPFCAETIQRAAIVCRFCGRDLPSPAEVATKESVTVPSPVPADAVEPPPKPLLFRGAWLVSDDGDQLTIRCGQCRAEQTVSAAAASWTCTSCGVESWATVCPRCHHPSVAMGTPRFVCPRCDSATTPITVRQLFDT